MKNVIMLLAAMITTAECDKRINDKTCATACMISFAQDGGYMAAGKCRCYKDHPVRFLKEAPDYLNGTDLGTFGTQGTYY